MKDKRKCSVCDKKIIIYDELLGHTRRQMHYASKTILLSDEGTLFRKNWFCNDCWSKIMHYTINKLSDD